MVIADSVNNDFRSWKINEPIIGWDRPTGPKTDVDDPLAIDGPALQNYCCLLFFYETTVHYFWKMNLKTERITLFSLHV